MSGTGHESGFPKKREKMVVEIGKLRQIGVVRSPYKTRKAAPSQGRHTEDITTLEIFEDYEPALLDIEKCSHLIVLYWMDQGRRDVLQNRTPWGPKVHGVFATRSPNRPNPIGFCVADLLERDGRLLQVRGLDALDGSPLIDIKPYSRLDAVPDSRIGWRERNSKEKE
jgi:formylmethanofuran dehydrogenase subunit E